jgi:hypothetical protein
MGELKYTKRENKVLDLNKMLLDAIRQNDKQKADLVLKEWRELSDQSLVERSKDIMDDKLIKEVRAASANFDEAYLILRKLSWVARAKHATDKQVV